MRDIKKSSLVAFLGVVAILMVVLLPERCSTSRKEILSKIQSEHQRSKEAIRSGRVDVISVAEFHHDANYSYTKRYQTLFMEKRHRDPKHTAHYTRVAGVRFEGLSRSSVGALPQ